MLDINNVRIVSSAEYKRIKSIKHKFFIDSSCKSRYIRLSTGQAINLLKTYTSHGTNANPYLCKMEQVTKIHDNFKLKRDVGKAFDVKITKAELWADAFKEVTQCFYIELHHAGVEVMKLQYFINMGTLHYKVNVHDENGYKGQFKVGTFKREQSTVGHFETILEHAYTRFNEKIAELSRDLEQERKDAKRKELENQLNAISEQANSIKNELKEL